MAKNEVIKVRCDDCNSVLFDFVRTDEYPEGAIVVIAKHHGKEHVTVKPFREFGEVNKAEQKKRQPRLADEL